MYILYHYTSTCNPSHFYQPSFWFISIYLKKQLCFIYVILNGKEGLCLFYICLSRLCLMRGCVCVIKIAEFSFIESIWGVPTWFILFLWTKINVRAPSPFPFAWDQNLVTVEHAFLFYFTCVIDIFCFF